VRLLAAGVHASLLQIPAVRDSLLSFIKDVAPSSQVESILGAWYMTAHDVDRSTSVTALKSWNEALSFDDSPSHLVVDEHLLSLLVSFLQRAILDPDGLYLYLNPAPSATPATPTPQKRGAKKEEPPPASVSRSKTEDIEEDPQDQKARLRVGGLGAVRRIIGIYRLSALSMYSNLAITRINTKRLVGRHENSSSQPRLVEFFTSWSEWSIS